MKVLLFGATGMVGQGVLREALLDSEVERVLVVGRSPGATRHEKLLERICPNLPDLGPVEDALGDYDACLFCLGVSAAGMSEEAYRKITFDLTLGVGERLASPKMTFIYVSGEGTDSTERGRSMWARVKGATENALLKLPFKAAYMFRPGLIKPMHGITSRTPLYRVFYSVLSPLYPVLKAIAPTHFTTTERVGLAMLEVAKHGAPKPVLETPDINAIADRRTQHSNRVNESTID